MKIYESHAKGHMSHICPLACHSYDLEKAGIFVMALPKMSA